MNYLWLNNIDDPIVFYYIDGVCETDLPRLQQEKFHGQLVWRKALPGSAIQGITNQTSIDSIRQTKTNHDGIMSSGKTQRGLPRIDRRQKWETAGRIILDDHFVMNLPYRRPPRLTWSRNSHHTRLRVRLESPTLPLTRTSLWCLRLRVTQVRRWGWRLSRVRSWIIKLRRAYWRLRLMKSWVVRWQITVGGIRKWTMLHIMFKHLAKRRGT